MAEAAESTLDGTSPCMNRCLVFVTVPSILALLLQLFLAWDEGAVDFSRVCTIILSGALSLYGWKVLPESRPGILSRVLVPLVVPALLWLSLLELLVFFLPVLALGFFLIASAMLVHMLILVVCLAPEPPAVFLRRVCTGLLLCVTVIMALLLAIEGGYRWSVPVYLYEIVPDDRWSAPCLESDENGVTRATPGFRGQFMHPEFPGLRVEINDYGFRDGLDEATPPSKEATSVVVLGDSFTFGTGVKLEETFHELLEGRSEELGVDPLRVYGAGIPGHGQVHEEEVLARMAGELRPDVVVVAVYEGNDFTDNMLLEGRKLGKVPDVDAMNEAMERNRRERGRRFSRFLGSLTHLPFWLGSSAAFQCFYPTLEEGLIEKGWVRKRVPSNRFLTASLQSEREPFVDIGLAHARVIFERMEKQCEELGAELVILVIPAVVQASPGRFEELLSLHPPPRRGGFDRLKFHQDFIRLLGEEGHHVVDTLPLLQETEERGDPAYWKEGHWNARGHEIAAEILAPVLKEVIARRSGEN